jgi:hypothetical protein
MASLLIDSDAPIDAAALFSAVSRHCPGAELITDAMAAVVSRGVEGPALGQPRRLVPLLRVPISGGRWLRGEVDGRAASLLCPPPVTEADVAPVLAAIAEVPGLRVLVCGVEQTPVPQRGCSQGGCPVSSPG